MKDTYQNKVDVYRLGLFLIMQKVKLRHEIDMPELIARFSSLIVNTPFSNRCKTFPILVTHT